jgi:GNAT superfamily N-acetyltransferase
MIRLIRTNTSDPDFLHLVKQLDEDLRIRDGDDHVFYAQFNSLEKIKHAIIAYVDDVPAGCGAFRAHDDHGAEIKRMFVHPDFRRHGIARQVLMHLENWAREEGFNHCVLETGQNQPEAIQLYKSAGYHPIPNYGPYADVGNSICLKKELS